MKSLAKRIAAAVLSAALALGFVPVALPSAAFADGAAVPTVDGDLSEWSGIAKQVSTDSDVDYWQVAKDSEGNVYLAVSGISHNSYYFSWQWDSSKAIGLTLDGKSTTTQLAPLQQGNGTLKGSYAYHDESSNNYGPLYVEVKLDASSFKGSDDYSLTFAGTTVKASDIPAFGSAQTSSSSSASEPDEPTTYDGIAIDGKFSDWNAVEKHDGGSGIQSAAMVFDGDHVYLYLEDSGNSSATWSGPNGNGRFAITTDLGHVLMVHVERDQVLVGGRPVSFQHVGSKWEIDVPASLLPGYQKTIDFGFYQGKTFVEDVANLQGGNGNVGEFDGISYDGDYSDWDAYPHTVIQYATPGTQDELADAEGALYSQGTTLFTHVKTGMPAHLNEKGGEFTQAVTYDFGDGRTLYLMFATVDSQGNISWNNGGAPLSAGTHELYIFDTSAWRTSANINSLNENDRNYGKVTVTIGEDGSIDEMESEIDLNQVAQKFNCSAEDFKTIRAQFGRIGQQWLETAGTPTGAWLGTGIAIASVIVVVGGYALYRRRKLGSKANAAQTR